MTRRKHVTSSTRGWSRSITRLLLQRRLAGDGESGGVAEMGVARKAARPGLEREHPAVGATEAGAVEAAGGPHRVAEA